jgi:hypothetical protein
MQDFANAWRNYLSSGLRKDSNQAMTAIGGNMNEDESDDDKNFGCNTDDAAYWSLLE